MTKPNSALVVFILDRSGSMRSVWEATISGFNEFKNGRKADVGETLFSLIQFDHEYEVNYLAKPIAEVPDLDQFTYAPRGQTALHDAIGRAILETGRSLAAKEEADRPDRVFFVIQTDGFENASHEFNAGKLKDMIKHQQETYSWDFIFLGAGQDAILTANNIGILSAKAMHYQGTVAGSAAMFSTASAYVARGMSAGSADAFAENSFTEDERISNSAEGQNNA